eukprot:g23025.t1
MVWRIDLYIAEARHQLCDTSSYHPFSYDPTPDHQTIISETIHNFVSSADLPPTASNLSVPQPHTAPQKHLIFTMDIQSLYTCIPHVDDLKALRFFLSCRPNQSPSTDSLIHLAELVLTLINFSFNSSHFLQTKWVAMGTCMGPSYDCLF